MLAYDQVLSQLEKPWEESEVGLLVTRVLAQSPAQIPAFLLKLEAGSLPPAFPEITLVFQKSGTSRVGDPDPNVFGPPGSISQRYGSESRSFPFLIKVLSMLKLC
jgi:hypothetical protein